jgi:YCII-related domain
VTATNTYLAVFLGSRTSAKGAAWNALSEADRRAKEQQGMAAWKAWAEKYQDAIVYMGGPLGKTKKVDANGVADVSNLLGAFTVVRADSHEAATKMFEGHPHFTVFPGEGVEIMPVLPIPGG